MCRRRREDRWRGPTVDTVSGRPPPPIFPTTTTHSTVSSLVTFSIYSPVRTAAPPYWKCVGSSVPRADLSSSTSSRPSTPRSESGRTSLACFLPSWEGLVPFLCARPWRPLAYVNSDMPLACSRDCAPAFSWQFRAKQYSSSLSVRPRSNRISNRPLDPILAMSYRSSTMKAATLHTSQNWWLWWPSSRVWSPCCA